MSDFAVVRSVPIRANGDAIWRVLTDVTRWNRFDAHLAHSGLDGPFQVGATGYVQPKIGPRREFELLEVQAPTFFVAEMTMPLCRMRFPHRVVDEGEGVRVEMAIEMVGPLAWFYRRLLAGRMTRGLEVSLANLRALVEAGGDV
ncbi:MAG: SRPBCC family protein [Deltaproteobacteria bacterium]|nr:SRPBCC family protein [Deltaproteobacteria bacterium]